jgi:hypothetical protein
MERVRAEVGRADVLEEFYRRLDNIRRSAA